MSEQLPYLPAAEPTDNPKEKIGAKRILLWLLLVLVFVSIYQLFAGPSPPQRTTQLPTPVHEVSFFTLLCGSWLPMLAQFGVFYWLALSFVRWQLRGGARLNAKLEPGHIALADGDMQLAVEVYRRVAQDYRRQRHYAALANLSLAEAYIRQGEFDAAIGVLRVADKTRNLMFGSNIRVMVATDLCLIYALRGDLNAAMRWLEDARRRLARSKEVRHFNAALLRLTEATVLCRAGKHEEAKRILDSDWPRLESALFSSVMRRAWLLRAFLAGSDPTRMSGEPMLTVLRSARKNELEWMGKEWPELRTFLVTHDLAGTDQART
jgi:hypothetical protein